MALTRPSSPLSRAQQVKTQRPVKPGARLASLPEQQVLLGGPVAQAVALALEEVAVDFSVLGQGLDDDGLAQAALPQLLLPQQPVEQLLLGGIHLHRASPHPQRAAVIHLQTSGEKELVPNNVPTRHTLLKITDFFFLVHFFFSYIISLILP